MGSLTITKNWSDGAILTESDLDYIKSDIETFINSTKLDYANIQTGGIATANLADSVVVNSKIADATIEIAKLSTTASPFLVPSGSLIPFAGPKTGVPTGWLYCDGTSLLRASYPTLFTAIGTAWGTADATHFNIPDLRGRFLRGYDDGQTRDLDAATRTASATGGATGDNVGTVQISCIDGKYETYSGGHSPSVQDIPRDGSFGSSTATGDGVVGTTWGVRMASDAAGDTRPINAAICYIIKV